MRVVVVGAGISGLTTAFRIKERAEAQGRALSLTVLESGPQAGGTIRTVARDGFRCEAGPNGFLDSKPETMQLVSDLGLTGQLLRSDDAARRRFVMVNGGLIELPSSPGGFMKSPLLSFASRMRVVREMWVAKRTDGADETVAEFASRRLGPQAYARLVDPFVSGIFAGDPNKLSLKAAFPRLAELEAEYGSLLKASRQLADQRKNDPDANAAGPSGRLTSFSDGMLVLVEALVAALDGAVQCDTPVSGLERSGTEWTVSAGNQKWSADAVVLAVPAGAAARLLSGVDPQLGAPLDGIPYPALSVVALGYAREQVRHDLNGFGFLIPSEEKRKLLGCLWTSSIFPGCRAPEGHVMLRSMVGGARASDLALQDDDALVAMVESELGLLGIDGKPAFINITRWPRAIPQYNQGHIELRDELDARLIKCPGLFVTGNALRGVGINDCTRDSALVAERVMSED